MKNIVGIIISLSLGLSFTLNAKESELAKLDEVLAKREYYQDRKEARIDSIRKTLNARMSTDEKFETYNKLFAEYLTYNYDSAMVYVEKSARLFDHSDDYNRKAQIDINRAQSLATSGHFSNAIDILNGIDSKRLSREIQDAYFTACEWTYGVWAEYADKRTIAPEFTAKSLVYLDSLITITDSSDIQYSYRIAERDLRLKKYDEAEKNYLKTLAIVPITDRLYAQAAYALALVYKGKGNMDKYQEWLINAAISDQVIPLKENLALQQLAAYIKDENGNLSKANEYLRIALDDAMFYNNRLRLLEIAEKIPGIATVYQDKIKMQNSRLKLFLIIIGVLSLLLVSAIIYVYKQRCKVSVAKDALAELNEKLKQLNIELSNTNSLREQYVSLYLDLCAAYIEKLNRFPMYLKLKVKNMNDLASVADKYVRPTEFETREMFFNFDTAFLRLYPDFIEKFNALLASEKQVAPKKGELLNTDLRIYALVRMGITDSNKIATLLFLSPQTIFNHRTQVRNKAINRDTFESEVAKLCNTPTEA